jgi:hypothetical protein
MISPNLAKTNLSNTQSSSDMKGHKLALSIQLRITPMFIQNPPLLLSISTFQNPVLQMRSAWFIPGRQERMTCWFNVSCVEILFNPLIWLNLRQEDVREDREISGIF